MVGTASPEVSCNLIGLMSNEIIISSADAPWYDSNIISFGSISTNVSKTTSTFLVMVNLDVAKPKLTS